MSEKTIDRIIVAIIVIGLLLLLLKFCAWGAELDSHALDRRPGATATTSYRWDRH